MSTAYCLLASSHLCNSSVNGSSCAEEARAVPSKSFNTPDNSLMSFGFNCPLDLYASIVSIAASRSMDAMRCFFTALSEAVSAVFCTISVQVMSTALSLCVFQPSALLRLKIAFLLMPYFAASSLNDEPPMYSALMAFQSALIAHHPFNGETSLQALAEAQGVEPR